jgi:hypothetical protein
LLTLIFYIMSCTRVQVLVLTDYIWIIRIRGVWMRLTVES